MLTRIFQRWRSVRRAFSRSEWGIRLLGATREEGAAAMPGLVIAQIDGLSQRQLERAMAEGRMPFHADLVRRHGHRVWPLFSGLPSTTPAAQAEMFYGVTSAVPAFSYRQADSGRLVHMFHPKAAASVEADLAARGEGLLRGGSAWCNIYSGGAAEANMCSSSLDAELRALRPLPVLALALLHAWSAVRIAVLAVAEIGVALWDAARGASRGYALGAELRMVASRVLVGVVAREIATIGARIDAARGLPIIHVNYVGYDEQAHRRGPGSLFAHVALEGIDAAIARLWAGARRSGRRDYELWILSDHGQGDVVPYLSITGRTLARSLALAAGVEDDAVEDAEDPRALRHERASTLRKLLPFLGSRPPQDEPVVRSAQAFGVAALGPVAHVYLPQALRSDPSALAEALVRDHEVPSVLAAGPDGGVIAWTREGRLELPRDAASLLGAQHPYLPETTEGLIAIVRHGSAGHLVACGYRAGGRSVTFAREHGAHGGPGPDEVGAFALLPSDAPVEDVARPWLRALDVREAALHALGRSPKPWPRRPLAARASAELIRVLTYNVHACRGMDGRRSTQRIARVIARLDPDVACLQELDVNRPRSGGVDQARELASSLAMDFHFHPALRVEEEAYGNAVLSRLPLELVHAAQLPGVELPGPREPRGALWVAVDVRGIRLQLITTHLGLGRRERVLQAEALLGPEWLASPDCTGPRVLCGDFNEPPRAPAWRRIAGLMADAQLALPAHSPRATFSTHAPVARIDHVFVSREVSVVSVEVPRSELAVMASDHLPLLVTLRLAQPPREV